MDLIDYEKLCKSCDEILTSKESSVVTKSIPWLHVLHPHPTIQEKYLNIWGKRKGNKHLSLFMSLGRFLRNIIVGDALPKFVSSNSKIKTTDLLIVSHLVNKDHLGKDEDFYFGNMTSELSNNGIASQILLINHIGLNPKNMANSWGYKSLPRLFFPNKLSFFSELLLLYRLLKESVLLRKASTREKDKAVSDIYMAASKAAISFESVSAFRFLQQFEHLISKLQPKAILITMEGHAYERLAFHASRRINSNTKCFGYQHAILFPHQHAVKRSLGPDYDPDIIFTAGNKTTKVLKRGYKKEIIKFINIGTHRFSCPETIYDLTPQDYGSVCLVLPDGNISECLDLCQFAFNAAESISEIQFVIRLHPLNTIEMVISKNKVFKKLPSNLCFSVNNDIQADFKISKWALYRGSGAAIHSVMAGCRPIYISSKLEISIDPLYEVNSGRKIVYDLHELKKIMLEDILLTDKSFNGELEELFAYCKDYFTPPDIKGLLDALHIKRGSKQ